MSTGPRLHGESDGLYSHNLVLLAGPSILGEMSRALARVGNFIDYLQEYQNYFSARESPPLGKRLKGRLIVRFGKWKTEYAEGMKRIW